MNIDPALGRFSGCFSRLRAFKSFMRARIAAGSSRRSSNIELRTIPPRVSGSVVTGTISVAAGAVLNGSVEMKGTMEAKS